MRLIRALRDCKQRSSTVSKKAPTASKKASPFWAQRMPGRVRERVHKNGECPRDSLWPFGPQAPAYLSGAMRVSPHSPRWLLKRPRDTPWALGACAMTTNFLVLPVRGCEIWRDRASQTHSPSQRESYSGRGGEAEIACSIQPVQGATKQRRRYAFVSA